MWSSVVIFSSFLVFSAYACDAPVKPKPNCEAPTIVHQATTNTAEGKMTSYRHTDDNTTITFECNRVSKNHNVVITIEYYHFHLDKNHHLQQEIGTQIAVGASLTYTCDPKLKMYIGSEGEDFANVVRRLRCNSFPKTYELDFVKTELRAYEMPKE